MLLDRGNAPTSTAKDDCDPLTACLSNPLAVWTGPGLLDVFASRKTRISSDMFPNGHKRILPRLRIRTPDRSNVDQPSESHTSADRQSPKGGGGDQGVSIAQQRAAQRLREKAWSLTYKLKPPDFLDGLLPETSSRKKKKHGKKRLSEEEVRINEAKWQELVENKKRSEEKLVKVVEARSSNCNFYIRYKDEEPVKPEAPPKRHGVLGLCDEVDHTTRLMRALKPIKRGYSLDNPLTCDTPQYTLRSGMYM
jgi:hypothetical protein